MLKRRKIRELAMQILFLWDTQQEQTPESRRPRRRRRHRRPRSPPPGHRHGRWHLGAAATHRHLDRTARPAVAARRQPAVDRNLLRLAVWELTNTDTPPKVVIDEAIELAKQFSTEQSAAFVNGVLDAVLKENNRRKD